MTSIMLFCTELEAYPIRKSPIHLIPLANDPIKFVREALNFSDYAPDIPDPWLLVESKPNLKDTSLFKKQLKARDETTDSEFIGASPQDCEAWMLAEQDELNFMEFNILFIADARSARDETLLASVYRREQGVYGAEAGKSEGVKAPPEPNSWYHFRIDFKEAWNLHSDVNYGPPGQVEPFYSTRKERR